LLDHLHTPSPSTSQKIHKELWVEIENYDKNNWGLFWELEHGIIGRKKNNVVRPN